MATKSSITRSQSYSPVELKAKMHQWIKEYFGRDEDLSQFVLLEDILRGDKVAFLVNNEEDRGYVFCDERMAGEDWYVRFALEKHDFLSQSGYSGVFFKDKDSKIAGFSFQARRQAA